VPEEALGQSKRTGTWPDEAFGPDREHHQAGAAR